LQIQKHPGFPGKTQTCKKPLKGASPVPGPIMIIGVDGSTGNLKFDCLTKIGAQLHSSLYSNGIVFCQADDQGTTKSDCRKLTADDARGKECGVPSSTSNKLLGGSFLLAKDHKLMHTLHEFWREPSCTEDI